MNTYPTPHTVRCFRDGKNIHLSWRVPDDIRTEKYNVEIERCSGADDVVSFYVAKDYEAFLDIGAATEDYIYRVRFAAFHPDTTMSPWVEITPEIHA